MPAVISATPEEQNGADRKMFSALKRYIIRERQRKKEEYEAEVEEERQRKEREARDVMTLEETKEQIEVLEQKLKLLEKEKQQLFMQLKRVLNEDEIRKRQQQKDANEMQSMKMPMGNIQIPMFQMPTSTGQGEQQQNQGRPPPLSSHILNKNKHSNYMLFPQQQTIVRGPVQSVKRPRSPSPNYSLYAHRIHQPPMKHQSVYSDHKPSQYASSGSYYMPTSGVVGVVGERPPPLLYAHHAHSQHSNLMYAPAQPMYLDMLKNREQHEQKKEQQPQVLIGLSEAHSSVSSAGVVYAPPVSRHLSIHPPPQHNNMQTPKQGSITQGYSVQQSNANVQNPNIYPNRHRY
ncbi:G protein pathway suppressor 2 isoform X2 [Aricia agestis]|uniref:G protein pathway suppressor 2 isoform X2 n=1 Tax=Aricia agestis TaxID=91739 RepID=UPI001C20AFCA|nr:G protein pathway suppressor 2 isoform X2 [Aricia agestis]